ncbi:hypothetical protein DEO72_LG4g785 [Vigna unguiculata]|uniref:Uncharacterized protein n=1 Tax=Vigna unguiculata TaxID=3917 RepID=A0A4D6LNA0_VIGUN|nr:hypothetical protein DEO72_LG4g785 [Vigna unguiculata]
MTATLDITQRLFETICEEKAKAERSRVLDNDAPKNRMSPVMFPTAGTRCSGHGKRKKEICRRWVMIGVVAGELAARCCGGAVKQKQRRTVTEVGVVVVSRRRGCHFSYVYIKALSDGMVIDFLSLHQGPLRWNGH